MPCPPLSSEEEALWRLGAKFDIGIVKGLPYNGEDRTAYIIQLVAAEPGMVGTHCWIIVRKCMLPYALDELDLDLNSYIINWADRVQKGTLLPSFEPPKEGQVVFVSGNGKRP